MKWHPIAPTITQRHCRVVCGEDLIEIWASEQGKHRQVGLAMPAVRGWIDEHNAMFRPEHVAVPQVAVDAPWRFVIVERAGGDSVARLTDVVDLARLDAAGLQRDLEIRQHSVSRVERTPTRFISNGKWSFADIYRTGRAVRRSAECCCARCMSPSQIGAEPPSSVRRRPRLAHPLELDAPRFDRDHLNDTSAACGREPTQPGGLRLIKPFRPSCLLLHIRAVETHDSTLHDVGVQRRFSIAAPEPSTITSTASENATMTSCAPKSDSAMPTATTGIVSPA